MSRTQQFKFIVKKGPNPGHVYPVFAEKMTIGRDPMSDIIFKDPEVSRRHVQFIRDGNSYLVEDLGSTNGTFVNGQRLVGQPIRLQAKQEVALGGAITLIFAEQDSEIDLGSLGTLNANLPTGNPILDSGTADHNGSLAEYKLDEVDELDEEFDDDDEENEKEEGSPHIDRLQSLPSLSPKPFLGSQVLQSSKEPSPLAEEARTFTKQQLIYMVAGTAVTTMILCGILTLVLYFTYWQ